MRRRREPDPDEVAERRAVVESLLDEARRHQQSRLHRGEHQRAAWFAEAIARLEVIAASDDPDLGAARAAQSFGHHVTLDQASAGWQR